MHNRRINLVELSVRDLLLVIIYFTLIRYSDDISCMNTTELSDNQNSERDSQQDDNDQNTQIEHVPLDNVNNENINVEPNEPDDSELCVVCRKSEYEDNQLKKLICCKQLLCTVCLNNILTAENLTDSCPMCRKKFNMTSRYIKKYYSVFELVHDVIINVISKTFEEYLYYAYLLSSAISVLFYSTAYTLIDKSILSYVMSGVGAMAAIRLIIYVDLIYLYDKKNGETSYYRSHRYLIRESGIELDRKYHLRYMSMLVLMESLVPIGTYLLYNPYFYLIRNFMVTVQLIFYTLYIDYGIIVNTVQDHSTVLEDI